MGQTGFCKNLRFPAVFCENLRFPAVFCENLRLHNAGIARKAKISKNLRKSAKNCEFRAFVPFSLSLLVPPDLQRSLRPSGPKTPKKSRKCLSGPPAPAPQKVSKMSRNTPKTLSRHFFSETCWTVPETFLRLFAGKSTLWTNTGQD